MAKEILSPKNRRSVVWGRLVLRKLIVIRTLQFVGIVLKRLSTLETPAICQIIRKHPAVDLMAMAKKRFQSFKNNL